MYRSPLLSLVFFARGAFLLAVGDCGVLGAWSERDLGWETKRRAIDGEQGAGAAFLVLSCHPFACGGCVGHGVVTQQTKASNPPLKNNETLIAFVALLLRQVNTLAAYPYTLLRTRTCNIEML